MITIIMCFLLLWLRADFSFLIFPMFTNGLLAICAPHTRVLALADNSKLNSTQLGKTASKARKEQRERERGKAKEYVGANTRAFSHSLSGSIVAAAFCFFDVLWFVYKYRLVNKC